MRSYKKTHSMCTLPPTSAHILGDSHASGAHNVLYIRKYVIFSNVLAYPHCHILHHPTHPAEQITSETSDTMYCVLHRILHSVYIIIPMVGMFPYIILFYWDSAQQMVSLELSGFIWIKHSSDIKHKRFDIPNGKMQHTAVCHKIVESQQCDVITVFS